MLYFLHGNDTDKAREKAHEMLASLQNKKPDAELFRLDSDNFNSARLEEFVSAQGLFERKFIVSASRLFENKEVKEVVVQKLADIVKSESVFIFLEGAVDKPTLQKIEKAGGKVQVFESDEKREEKFNVFALANALRARDRKELWVLYQKALRADVAPEAISGMLFWQVKDLLLKRSANFSRPELETLAQKLVALYHDSHRGLTDFETGLESFVLAV